MLETITTIADLVPDKRNARRRGPRAEGMLVASLQEVGASRSIVIDEDGRILAGNGTVQAAGEAGIERVHVVDVDGETIVAVRRTGLTDAQKKRLAILDNRTGELAEWDAEVLAELAQEGVELNDLWSEDELSAILATVGVHTDATGAVALANETLAQRFGVPPFSVLDARQGYWQERKRAWIALGIQSELGRGENLQALSEQNDERNIQPCHIDKRRSAPTAEPGGSKRPASTLGKDGKTVRGDGTGRQIVESTLGAIAPNENGANGILASPGKYAVRGREIATSNSSQSRLNALQRTGDSRNGLLGESEQARTKYGVAFGTEGNASEQSGTSIFDPVLCELAYRWFCTKGGRILDPFAGGSVRGIVAAYLGHCYTGIDLRPEQLAANESQAASIVPKNPPKWITGDSRNVADLAAGQYDFIFSCPPYADLEVYSDNPADLSTMTYDAFIEAYRQIIATSVSMLKENRFACFVVGDIRDKKGFYRNFVSDTIAAFEDAGVTLYNEAILVTAVGSLPIRVGKQFGRYRKLGKTHQNVLVFYKGDVKLIPAELGEVEFTEELPGTDAVTLDGTGI